MTLNQIFVSLLFTGTLSSIRMAKSPKALQLQTECVSFVAFNLQPAVSHAPILLKNSGGCRNTLSKTLNTLKPAQFIQTEVEILTI